MGKHFVGVATRANIRSVDIFGHDPGVYKYQLIRKGQIEHITTVFFRLKNKRHIKSGGGKSRINGIVDLITARTDARTYRRYYILSLRSETTFHNTDRLCAYLFYGTAPARMDRSDNAPYRVAKYNGGAIGKLSNKGDALSVSYESVNIFKALLSAP